MKAEVVLLLYNRPDHALSVVDSLIENGVERVRAFMDHPADAEVARGQERFLDEVGRRPRFSLDLHRQEQRLGLAKSVRFALRSVFETADAAIVLEDDCVVRPGGMEFFLTGLGALEHDRRIRSLCGYLFPCPFLRSDADPLLLRRFCTWGWATWRDRWRDYDENLGRVVERLEGRNLRPEDLGDDLSELCRSAKFLDGRADVWSPSWILEHYASGTFCVYPCDSLIDNIGFDGTGKNCRSTDAFATSGAGPRRAWNFEQLYHCVENEELLKDFMSRHGLTTYPSA
jgi:hypothetical protein